MQTLKAMHLLKASIMPLVRPLDTNHDGKLDPYEVMAAFEPLFSNMQTALKAKEIHTRAHSTTNMDMDMDM